MKKYVLIIILVLCGVGYLAYYYVSSRDETKMIKETVESTLDLKEHTVISDSSQAVNTKTTETSSQEVDELDVEILIKRFCNKWLNFNDVYERNQSVKEYVTDECAKDNTLDVDPNVKYDSTGEIESISQNIDKARNYVVIGKESSQNYVNVFILELELNKEKTKIAKIDMSYVKKGY